MKAECERRDRCCTLVGNHPRRAEVIADQPVGLAIERSRKISKRGAAGERSQNILTALAQCCLRRPPAQATCIRSALQECFVQIGDKLRVRNGAVVGLSGKQTAAKSQPAELVISICLWPTAGKFCIVDHRCKNQSDNQPNFHD